jgi:hypothetical protein
VRVAAIFFACLVTSCAQHSGKGWVPNDEFLFKSADEQHQFEQRAIAGDIEAGRRLADYYFFCRNDPKKALHWAEVAASHGDKVSAGNVRTIKEIIREQKG